MFQSLLSPIFSKSPLATRENDHIRLGVSPRGSLALMRAARGLQPPAPDVNMSFRMT